MARDDPYLDKRIRSEIGDVIFRLDAAEARRKHVEEHRDPIAARLEYRREELGLEAPTGMFWKMSERWGGTGGGDGIAAHRAAPRFLVTVPPLVIRWSQVWIFATGAPRARPALGGRD